MTEQDWVAETSVDRLAAYMLFRTREPRSLPSNRKARLFACACARALWPLLKDPRSREAVRLAEERADLSYGFGLSGWDAAHNRAVEARAEIQQRLGGAGYDHPEVRAAVIAEDAVLTVAAIPRDPVPVPDAADRLREICGNPFYAPPDPAPFRNPTTVALAHAAYDSVAVCKKCEGKGVVWAGDLPGDEENEYVCPNCGRACSMLGHVTDVLEERAGKGPYNCPTKTCPACLGQTGRLDPDAFSVLSDALEDAGLQDERILRHCRGEEYIASENGTWRICENPRCGRPFHEKEKANTGRCPVCVGDRYCKARWYIPRRCPYLKGDWVLDWILGRK